MVYKDNRYAKLEFSLGQLEIDAVGPIVNELVGLPAAKLWFFWSRVLHSPQLAWASFKSIWPHLNAKDNN